VQITKNLRKFSYYYRHFGLVGAAAVSTSYCFGRPKDFGIKARDIKHPVHIRIGTMDMPLFGDILVDHEYDFDVPFPVRTVIDAGANIGLASVYFANRFPAARIIAIEPEAANFRMLVKNTRAYPNVTPIQAALWKCDGQLSIGMPDSSTGASGEWAFVVSERQSGQKVEALSLKTITTRFEMSFVDVLKIDIEGSEKEVFETCDWADLVGCVMIETHDRFRAGCSAAVDSALAAFNRVTNRHTSFYCRTPSRENAGAKPSTRN
jgi:FkbM family methyltransferase